MNQQPVEVFEHSQLNCYLNRLPEPHALRTIRFELVSTNAYTNSYCTVNEVWSVPWDTPDKQVTNMGQVPGVVWVPTSQVHVTWPSLSAVWGIKPLALLGPERY